MGSEIPQPADDEFEARLTWSPNGDDSERPAPAASSRPRARPPIRSSAAATVETNVESDTGRRLAELQAELRAVRQELEVVRGLFEELLGEDPAAAVADPDRTMSELGSTMRVRLRRRSSSL